MTLKTIERRRVIEKHGLRCYWCGVFTDDSIYNEGSHRATTIDHIFNNLDAERKNNNDKMVVACYACNQMRARMHEFVFRGNVPITSMPLVRPPDERADQVVVEKVEPMNEIAIAHERPMVEKIDTVETPSTPPIINLNPVIQGPVIVRGVPKAQSRWQRFKAWIALFW